MSYDAKTDINPKSLRKRNKTLLTVSNGTTKHIKARESVKTISVTIRKAIDVIEHKGVKYRRTSIGYEQDGFPIGDGGGSSLGLQPHSYWEKWRWDRFHPLDMDDRIELLRSGTDLDKILEGLLGGSVVDFYEAEAREEDEEAVYEEEKYLFCIGEFDDEGDLSSFYQFLTDEQYGK